MQGPGQGGNSAGQHGSADLVEREKKNENKMNNVNEGQGSG